ncbi:MAG TPA: (2Fe-2S)-binding protein [Blastocatellia bacterium]|jgi:xanthine dehydrogenase YagT iron-sulfur-binding subunit|nr:(2Fe-2S)-binding protein [Blastocatellia bacterium]
MRDDDEKVKEKSSELSRRHFLKVSGISLSVPLVMGHRVIKVAGADVKVFGPGKVPISLTVNGQKHAVEVETRVTLLEALRNDLDITGPKRVCDRASCGACTVIMDGKPVYSCTVLAIEAQGKKVTTAEGLMQGDRLHPLQQAFVDNDAQQCGFCTPGFVVACKAFLDKNPNPTPEQVQKGLGGNLCRCGTYMGIRAAVLQAASAQKGGRKNG